MDDKYLKKIREYHIKGVSLAGIVSLLYINDYKGLDHMSLRKFVKKETQRIEAREPYLFYK
jgi:hypothetical protein